MMEPQPPLPPPDPTKSWVDELAKWRPIAMSIVALATAIWLSVSAWIQGNKQDKNIQIAEQTKDVATEAAIDSKAVKINEIGGSLHDDRTLQNLQAATQETK